MSHHPHLPAITRSVALTFQGLIRPCMHSMLVGSGCIYPSVVESFAWVLVHLQPVVIVIVCHAIATDGGVGGVLDHGSVSIGALP